MKTTSSQFTIRSLDAGQERYAAMKQFLGPNRMSKADRAAFDKAIA